MEILFTILCASKSTYKLVELKNKGGLKIVNIDFS
jgi:hypothetical protein